MEKVINLNNQTAGRDKIARLIQYSCRVVWDSLEKFDLSEPSANNFKTLEYILSSFRKLLRFGKCLDIFYSSLSSIHNPDLILKITLTMSKLSLSLFLFADHLIWLSRTGLFRNINSKKWNKVANKYWLLSVVMNLARDIYEIIRLIDLHKAINKSGIKTQSIVPALTTILTSRKEFKRFALHSYATLYGHRDVVIDSIKNFCDVFIPLTALGYTKLSPRTIGILGILSSTAGLMALTQPNAKLLPS